MKIFVIVSKYENEQPSVVDALDEYTLDEAPAYLEDAVKTAKSRLPDGDVRVAEITVSDNFFNVVFGNTKVEGTIRG